MCILHCSASHVAHCATSHFAIGERREESRQAMNQRTIGPVNAYLISEPIISTKPVYKWPRDFLVQNALFCYQNGV